MIEAILKQAVDQNASDLFMIPGMPISLKIDGQICPMDDKKIFPDEMDTLISEIYSICSNRNMNHINECGDDDFSFSLPGYARFRASIMKQRSSLAAIIRIVRFDLPRPESLGIPESVLKIANFKKGLVLVTGAAGSGKSTTLACIIDKINQERSAHIITLEDPIEYLHRHGRSVVTQREVGQDTVSYLSGLRAALRQAPDVILLGEMRDYETIRVAMTAAETGHLVISTLHTIGAVNTIERIVDVFPPDGQQQIRVQLSMVLQAVISQQLVGSVDGKLIPAFETMFLNTAIRNQIRENKVAQIATQLSNSGPDSDSITMDQSLKNLYEAKKISMDTLISYSTNPDSIKKGRLF